MNPTAQRKLRLLIYFLIGLAALGPAALARKSSPTASAQKRPSNASSALPSSSSKPSSPASSNPAQPKDSPLRLVGEKSLLLDPACNACQGVSLELRVSAPDSLKAPHPLDLRAEHLVSDAGGEPANVQISIEPADAKQPLPPVIKPAQSVAFRVKVTGVLGSGKWKSDLFEGDERLGTVEFIVPHVALNLKLDTGDANPPSLTMTRGETAQILLKNDDAIGYPVRWEFRFGSTGSVVSNEKKVPAGGETILEVKPNDDWFKEAGNSPCLWPSWLTSWLEGVFGFPCNWRAIFKDKEAEGLLTVRLRSPACQEDAGAPVKIIRAKTALAYYSPPKKAWWSYLAILALLLAGALLSLYVNYKFPDEQIRSELRKQFAQCEKDVQDLSMRLASRLRVLAGIALRLLQNRLRTLKWYTTEFDKERAEITDASGKLVRRVNNLRLMGRLREAYERLMTQDVPPTILDNLEASFEQIGNLLDDLQVVDSDLQEAEVRLADLRKKIVGWAQPDPALAAQISAALQSLYKDLQPPGGLLSASATFLALTPQFPDVVRQLRTAPPNPGDIPANDYYRLDCLAFRGNLLRTYALLCDSRNPAPNSPLLTRRDELFARIKSESWDGLRKARRLVWEMSEEVYSDDIKREITAGRVEIRLDRNLVCSFEAALFYLKFHNARYDSAAARDEWSCTWNFGHGPFPDKPSDPSRHLEEQGWQVAHYFPRPLNYTLTAHFRHEEDGDLKDAHGVPIGPAKTVEVGKPGDEPEFTGNLASLKKLWWKSSRWWMGGNGNAVLRLVLALIPAILGMVAGAKDQFLKMDLYLGLGAVFLLGFGSDTVKNLLSQKPKS